MAKKNRDENEEPVIRDKRKIDPETGEVRAQSGEDAGAAAPAPQADPSAEGPHSEDGDTASVETADDLIQAEGPDIELSESDQAILDGAERDLVAEMRNDMLRAQAELVNFRTRVERDRQANREAVIAEVIRTLLPAIDDLARAREHGDLEEGSALDLVAQKLRTGFEKYGLRSVGEKGEPFDPHLHEALVQLPSADATEATIADVIETGYALGDRLIRAAKVAVSVPA